MSGGHTPAPWDAPKPTSITVEQWAGLHHAEAMQFVTVNFDGFRGESVAIVVYGDDDEQELANARLIAAAPELLAACAAIVRAYDTLDLSGEDEAVDAARAAIAKAEGKS